MIHVLTIVQLILIYVIRYCIVSCPFAQLIKHYAFKTYGGVDAYTQIILTSVVVGEWSTLRTGRLTLRERASGTLWEKCLGGPKAGVNDMEK